MSKVLPKEVVVVKRGLKRGNGRIGNRGRGSHNNGMGLWNDLPSHIKEKQSIYDFKMTVKKHFLELLTE